MHEPLLKIEGLCAEAGGVEILRGLDLEVKAGEVHSIMGPNGSGKSTLAKVLAGREGYEVTSGSVLFKGQDLLELEPDERAREGVFLAFQYPVEIPGVSNMQFLKESINAVRTHRGQEPLDTVGFLGELREKLAVVGMNEQLLQRSVNEDFSGGEKKRYEIVQMSLLEPSLCVLDETDSGLDIDALRVVSEGINRMRSPERAMVLVTHYQRLLNYVQPDIVHVMVGGRIAQSGGKELALQLEERGYADFTGVADPAQQTNRQEASA
ncbi:MAG: Fe-S cluster assembly ATPase SufC [Phycisphaerales bacterium]|nr:Fe-S cluster assembly ATPase SufC [Phycisphaerales bacterium]